MVDDSAVVDASVDGASVVVVDDGVVIAVVTS